jgi:hypothetical protein
MLSIIIVTPNRLVTLTWTLVAWLHLTSNLGRDTAAKTLKFIFFLLTASFRLGARLHSVKPEDVIKQQTTMSTIMHRLSLDPDLERHICCPKCFTIYPDNYEEDDVTPIQLTCLCRETTRSHPCNTPLYTMRHVGGSKPRLVPVRRYTTQDFRSWLTWFLLRPEINAAIDASYTSRPRTAGSMMHDVWDSPAWHNLGERGDFCTTRGNLTFSYYVDWFNPFLNKVGGKHVSCGAIVMVCLNLPPEHRNKPENVFIASIIPPEREPDVVTFTHVADPVIDQLIPFYAGQAIPTASNEAGETIRIAVLPFIGDIPAIRKAAGFASHSAHNFCSFCNCTKANVECLDPRQWTYRDHWSCRNYALQWLDAKTKVLRTSLFKLSGVRWSSLYRLAYRDHVKHTMLGIMHCWLEGVLQHHTRYIWGIGSITPGDKTNTGSSSQRMDEDSGASGSESDATEMDTDTEQESQSEKPENPPKTSIFSKAQLQQIRAAIAEVQLPTWIERPPTNLGEKRHGKLKADHWLTLFTIILPMALVEMWAYGTPRERQLLVNLEQLVFCTHIACSYSTCDAEADKFDQVYSMYRRGLQELFPDIKSKPNHHYAMHIGALLKFWGPLMVLSEFAFERINGLLQKISTNNHLCMFLSRCLLVLSLIDTIRRSRLYHDATSMSSGPSSGGLELGSYLLSILRRARSAETTTHLDPSCPDLPRRAYPIENDHARRLDLRHHHGPVTGEGSDAHFAQACDRLNAPTRPLEHHIAIGNIIKAL